MKRADIEPGMDVYICPNWRWNERSESPETCRWTVVSAPVPDPVTGQASETETPFFRRRRHYPYGDVADPKGTAVKVTQTVMRYDHETGAWEPAGDGKLVTEYVPLARLRGEYETVKAERLPQIEAARRAAIEAEVRRDAERQVRDTALKQAQDLGFEGVYSHDRASVEMPVSTLRAMLGEIDRLRAAEVAHGNEDGAETIEGNGLYS